MSDAGSVTPTVEAPPLPITFSVVGVQKAATTTLYTLLGRHRRIVRGEIKERHFFDDETLEWDPPDYADYHAIPTKPWHRIAGDMTPIYLFWPRALERMRDYNPDMRLIASFRDPIERAFSQWSMERDRDPFFPDFDDVIADDRFAALPAAAAADSRDVTIRTHTLAARGLYGQQVRRGLECFDRDQWLMFDFRDLVGEPTSTLDRVTDFLGIDRYRRYPSLTRSHAGTSDHRGAPPSGDAIRALADLYGPDLADFEALSGVDTSPWPTSKVLAGDLDPGDLAAQLAKRAGLVG
ncbi:sulfotransferase family protein [Solicola gregarius]|uniref:Sulfotransferase n=1 Tax=Solicola gregarius TaxID=2908642 RepID=A0AA46TLI0_9ACTN|nr:sulfotransferase [Solicola gregarius]UYM07450.1 sulfotransferase [Solicola gregarius]